MRLECISANQVPAYGSLVSDGVELRLQHTTAVAGFSSIRFGIFASSPPLRIVLGPVKVACLPPPHEETILKLFLVTEVSLTLQTCFFVTVDELTLP